MCRKEKARPERKENVNLKSLEKKIPRGFILQKASGRLLVVRREWESVLRRLSGPTRGEAGEPTEFLQGRGRMPVYETSGGRVVVRHYFHGGLLRGLTRDLFFGPGRAMEELKMTAAAAQAGLPVPEAVGVIITPAGWGMIRADLVTVYIPGGIDLLSYLRGLKMPLSGAVIREKRRIIARAAARIREMHKHGFRHADLQLKNILVTGRGEEGTIRVFLLDFDRASRDNYTGLEDSVPGLSRLHRSFEKIRRLNPDLPSRDALRFLRDYTEGERKLFREGVGRIRKSRRLKGLHEWRWKLIMKGGGRLYPSPSRPGRKEKSTRSTTL